MTEVKTLSQVKQRRERRRSLRLDKEIAVAARYDVST
jgi:hypothetical protein